MRDSIIMRGGGKVQEGGEVLERKKKNAKTRRQTSTHQI